MEVGGGGGGVAVLGRRGVVGWNDEVALFREESSTVNPGCLRGFHRWRGAQCGLFFSIRKERKKCCPFFCFLLVEGRQDGARHIFTVFCSLKYWKRKKKDSFYILMALFLLFYFFYFKLLFWLTYWEEKDFIWEILTFFLEKAGEEWGGCAIAEWKKVEMEHFGIGGIHRFCVFIYLCKARKKYLNGNYDYD